MSAPREPLLLGVIAAALPSPAQARLLKACLLPGPAGREALEAWLAQPEAATPDTIGRSLADGRLLAPLVLSSLETHRLDAPPALLTYLRAAAAREDRRAAAVAEIAQGVFDLLRREGIPTLALKGAALAGSVYPKPGLRHTHDVDVMVPREHVRRAGAAIAAAGFTTEPGHLDAEGIPRLYTHTSGLPIALHRWIFSVHAFAEPLEEDVWRRSVAGPGVARMLCPADQVLHLAVHAMMHPQRGSLVWVPDLWFTLTRGPEAEWPVLLEGAARSGAALPLYNALQYLSRELGAPIPADVVAALQGMASRSSRAARELALGGARDEGAGVYGRLLRRARGVVEFAFVARWAFLPSLAYARWESGAAGISLARWYLRRYPRFIRRRFLPR